MKLNFQLAELKQKLDMKLGQVIVADSEQPVLQQKTVTPSAEDQQVTADEGFTSLEKVIVKGDADLKADNIPYGTNLFGVNGTYTSDATASPDKVFLDETFYAGGAKKTGSFTIESEVNSQNSLIASIKTALEGKASSLGDTLKKLLDVKQDASSLFKGYRANSIDEIVSYNTTENVTKMAAMFYESAISSIPLLNTSKVTSMEQMFYRCYSLRTTVPLLDTGEVTNMNSMFDQCYYITSVPPFNTSNVTKMAGMFADCKALTEVCLPDLSNVTSMYYAFKNCKAIKRVVLGKISSKVTDTLQLFYGCNALEEVYFKDATSVPKLTATNSFGGVPSTCKVVVPDALYDEWINATNWSAIDVIYVKQSEYTEE